MSDVVYITVPEYQPSSATLTIGGTPFYGTSGKTESISVKKAATEGFPILLIGIPIALIVGWLVLRTK